VQIIASGDAVRGTDTTDQIGAYASEKQRVNKNISGLAAKNNIKVTATINTWENSEIYAPFGTVNVKVQDGYCTDPGKISIEADVWGEGYKTNSARSNLAQNKYSEDLKVNVKHSTIIGNEVNLTASREAMNILAHSLGVTGTSVLSIGGVSAAAYNDLTFNTDVVIEDGSYVRGYSNVGITAKTESEDQAIRQHALSSIKASAETKNAWASHTCAAVNEGSMREKIAIKDSSYIYGGGVILKAIGWTQGDEVETSTVAGKVEKKSFFNEEGTEENTIEIDDGVILFIGSMAGAVVDIDIVGNNVVKARQFGLESTPEVTTDGNRVDILDRMIPDQRPGILVVERVRRVNERSYEQLVADSKKIESRAVSGGALTDTTIANRTGMPLGMWKRIDLNVKATQASYDYSASDSTNSKAYGYGSVIAQAGESYPAGGLISEVYYPNPIAGPTVTYVSDQRPEGIGYGYTEGIRSSVIVYRDLNGRLRTEVYTFGDDQSISRNPNPETGLSDAGSYYSYSGERPEWTEDRIIEAYVQDGSVPGRENDYAPSNRNAGNAAGSQSTSNAGGSQSAGSQSTSNASGSQNTGNASAGGSNAQSGTAGNQAEGPADNANGGSQNGLNDDVKGSSNGSDVDPDDGSEGTAAMATGGKMLPIAAAATVGAIFVVFLLLRRRKEEEEQ
jgi:hypothetical protein